MKTLINKNNSAIRITAPEFKMNEYRRWYTPDETRKTVELTPENWTLVEEEPKHTEVWVEGRTIFEQDAKKPEVDLEKTAAEKAKAYDKALEWMRKVYPTLTGADKEDAEYYFPELKESEDEKMLRTIIRGFENWKSNGMETFNNTKVDDILAYLEKQKEQKPADLVEEEYIENRNDGTYTCATTKDGFDAFMDGFNKGYELGIKEQTKK